MKSTGKNLFNTASLLIGTVVGAGIFGLPYAIVQGGIASAILFFIFVCFVVTICYLLYGEVVLRSRAPHRLVGYAEKYLGQWGNRTALLGSVLGVYGILTAHLIIGGIFLQAIFGFRFDHDRNFWGLAYFAVVATVTFFGLRLVSRVESWLTVLFLFLILGLTAWALPHAHFIYLVQKGSGEIFLPYGVIFFSLIGSTAIPQLRDTLGGNVRAVKPVIFWSMILSAFFTALFALAVVGVSGSATSMDALQGLSARLGDRVVFVGSIIGLLTVITTSFAVALHLREVYTLDFHIKRVLAWGLVFVVPPILYLYLTPNFINAVAFTGAFMGGLDGILITLMHRHARVLGDRTPEYEIRIAPWIGNILIAIFVFGILIEMIQIF